MMPRTIRLFSEPTQTHENLVKFFIAIPWHFQGFFMGFLWSKLWVLSWHRYHDKSHEKPLMNFMGHEILNFV